MNRLELRPATAADFAVAIDWAAAEGWNPGLDDLAAFHGADPKGFFLGWLGDEPVTSISVVRYGQDFGFLGFYIVQPDHRGRGYGWATWQHGMAYLEGATVGLDGVVAQQENYRKSGFQLAGRNVRHGGVPLLAGTGAKATAKTEIRPVTADDMDAVVAYDSAFCAGPREGFTRTWALPPEGTRRHALIARAGGAISGYGVIRDCRSGRKIGPLFAEDAGTAEALFAALCNTAPEDAEPGEVFLDTPEDNAAAVALAQHFDLQPVFETARMYRGEAPDLPTQRTFGITTFELG
jgi:hypothetical protein